MQSDGQAISITLRQMALIIGNPRNDEEDEESVEDTVLPEQLAVATKQILGVRSRLCERAQKDVRLAVYLFFGQPKLQKP
jgi:hypothetical protein